jgi:prepilin-type processing-associated H-X9-DG protein
LATIAGFAYQPIFSRAENAKCLANMRALHTALNAYVQDKGEWPQEPAELWQAGNSDSLEDWWVAALEPYGVTIVNWRCPTIFRALQKGDPEARPKTHFMPSKFEPGATAPYRWSTQPWLIEIGNMHGRGGNICFPDGSIRHMDEFLPASP